MSQQLCQWCRAPEHSGSCDREALKNVIQQLRLEVAARSKLEGSNVVMIRSLISNRTQKPRIDMQVGEIHTQMDADAAMDVAKNIIECSQGAYADAFIFNFLCEELKQEQHVAAAIIEGFREYRDKLAQEFDAMQKDKS